MLFDTMSAHCCSLMDLVCQGMRSNSHEQNLRSFVMVEEKRRSLYTTKIKGGEKVEKPVRAHLKDRLACWSYSREAQVQLAVDSLAVIELVHTR